MSHVFGTRSDREKGTDLSPCHSEGQRRLRCEIKWAKSPIGFMIKKGKEAELVSRQGPV